MKHWPSVFQPGLVAFLITLAFSARAFTFGDLHGTAVIGRVLDVSVKFQSGPGDEVSLNCLKAELYFADTRQMAPSVTLSASSDNPTALRIVSAGIVNEPVVTVLVRSSCGSSTLRRYVLLADFPSLVAAQIPAPAATRASVPMSLSAGSDSAPMLVLPVASESTALLQPTRQTAATDQGSNPVKNPNPPRPAKSKAAKPVISDTEKPEAVSGRSTGKAEIKTVKPGGKSLLKLDPLEFLSDRMDSLDSSMLFAPSEDAIKQTQQIASLQTEVKLLRELAQKNDARMADLQLKLEQAQVPSYTVWLLYVLLTLVVLCLAAIAWLWHKQRKVEEFESSAWWKDAQDEEEDHQPTQLMPRSDGLQNQAVADKVVPPEQSNPEELHDIDLDIDLGAFTMPETVPDLASIETDESATRTSVPTQPQDEFRSFQPLEAEATPVLSLDEPRRIGTEAIQDIRQQADFFVSLGQVDRALEILKSQIEQSSEPNPLVFLDTLTLYHQLGLKADFRDQREIVVQLFNAIVPDFPAFTLEGKDLDAYPEVLANIVSQWKNPQILQLLSQYIFHDPREQSRPLFDLAAFRSLLLLHTLAEELAFGEPMSDISANNLPTIAPWTDGGLDKPLFSKEEPAFASNAAEVSMALPFNFGQAEPVKHPPEETSAIDDDFAKAFAVDLALLPIVPKPDPKPESAPEFDPQAAFPIPDFPLPSETPSRMLDLDFSNLASSNMDEPAASDASEPIIQPPVRYATRARWPVGKKPK